MRKTLIKKKFLKAEKQKNVSPYWKDIKENFWKLVKYLSYVKENSKCEYPSIVTCLVFGKTDLGFRITIMLNALSLNKNPIFIYDVFNSCEMPQTLLKAEDEDYIVCVQKQEHYLNIYIYSK